MREHKIAFSITGFIDSFLTCQQYSAKSNIQLVLIVFSPANNTVRRVTYNSYFHTLCPFRFLTKKKKILFFKTSRPTPGPTLPHIQCVSGVTFKRTLTFWHRSFTFNSNKSPTWCNNFSVSYPDVCLQNNMFRAFSRPSSGAQWLQWPAGQPDHEHIATVTTIRR